MGYGFFENVHPEDLQRSLDTYVTAFDGRQEFQLEYRLRRFDGEYRWILDTGVPRFTPDGSFVGYIGSCIDITERKRTEVELQRAYQRLRLHVDNSPLAILEWNQEFRLQYWSEQAEKIFGWKAQELLNKHPLDWKFVYDEDVEMVDRLLCGLVDGAKQRSVDENRNYSKDGRIVYCQWYNSAIVDESGNLVSILSLVLDVTERKQAEAALQQLLLELETKVEERTADLKQANEQLQAEIAERQQTEAALASSEEQFRRVFDEAPLGMGLTALDGRFFRLNQAWLDMVGYNESELKALTCADITHPEDWKQTIPYLEQVSKGEISSFQREQRFLKKNQEILWGNLTSMVLRNEVGEILYALGMVEDITERKQAEAEILKALEKERELGELRSGFVSLVSHEFRTPLTTIQSSAELLERYSNRLSDEKKHNHLTRIQIAVKRMTQLLEDILTIGKAEAGKLHFEPSSMDLVAFCQEIVESMQMSARPRHTINFIVQGDGRDTLMDEKLLGHIVTNLLSNAMKYSPSGGTVQFDLICTDSLAIFRVQDSGIGIPKEDLEHLFESFGRASNVGTIPGTGLGLAIVKRCVDLHRGKIDVESAVGVGTTFTVTLPLKSMK
jgi:PAS domain S-box-containing protein